MAFGFGCGFGKNNGDASVGTAGNSELFTQFSDQRFRWHFIRFYLATGELPQARMVLSNRAAMHQPAPIVAR